MAAAGSGGGVTHINSDEEFQQHMQTAAQGAVAVDFSATWCGPCRQIAPMFEAMSGRFPSIKFFKVDVDKCPASSQAMEVSAMPTFIFFRDGRKINKFSGANVAELEANLRALGEEVGAGGAAGPNTDCGVPGHRLLTELIDKKQFTCLNQSDENVVEHALFEESGLLESDCDEQLLIRVTFQNPIKLHSLRIKAPEDGRAPCNIKLYVNTASMDFDDAEKIQETQALTLTTDNIKGEPVSLRFVKFQNVTTITVFVADNQGEAETTAIERLEFIGQPLEATSMKDFKRVAGEKGESDR